MGWVEIGWLGVGWLMGSGGDVQQEPSWNRPGLAASAPVVLLLFCWPAGIKTVCLCVRMSVCVCVSVCVYLCSSLHCSKCHIPYPTMMPVVKLPCG